MHSRLRGVAIACVILAVAVSARPASAQVQSNARLSLDSVVSIDAFQGQATVDDPNIVVDVTAVFRVADGWLVYLRPWFREPRLPHPHDPENWDKEIYQAALQYERTGRVSTRVDAGYIVSPIGLGMMDTRPGINPTIAPHLSYVQPLPAFEPGAPRVNIIAASYPLGTQLTFSTTKWDARAAVVNSAPTRAYVINRDGNPRSTPVVVTGGGVTPIGGLRLGAAIASGVYVRGDELTVPSDQDREFKMFNVEGDYAFGYTRISGEVTQTRFSTAIGDATARGWFVQGTQTLSPRWFVAARQEGVSAPPLLTAVTPAPRRTFHASEATVGYRLSRDLTLRSSFMSRKAYTRTAWDQQVGLSVVWAKRWW